jgi:hypothetical protein
MENVEARNLFIYIIIIGNMQSKRNFGSMENFKHSYLHTYECIHTKQEFVHNFSIITLITKYLCIIKAIIKIGMCEI